jgi:hypothetical protein
MITLKGWEQRKVDAVPPWEGRPLLKKTPTPPPPTT